MFFEGEEDGVRYRFDRDGQVLRLATEPAHSPRLAPRARDAGHSPSFVGAAVLALKAKQVDDGMFAAVELATQSGVGLFPGKRAFIDALVARLTTDAADFDGDARATLDAAASIGTDQPSRPGRAAAIREEFLADELRSKPIGFYTWSDELSRIFREDRLLQSDIGRAGDLTQVAETLRGDPLLRASYEACLRLPERLTNMLAYGDLRAAMSALDAGRPIPRGTTAFFPPSIAHETQLVKRLFGDRPIPDGFDLSKTLVEAVRSGAIDLTPRETSGLYDVQTWALETLAAPERALEAERLVLDPSYAQHLEELFRSILAATRETHIKQLELPAAGGMAPRPVKKLYVRPQLTVEPLVTFYQRRADSYRFARAVLVETFGEDGLAEMRGLRAGARAPVELSLGDELRWMIHLFDGAAATAMRELGMPTTWDTTTFERWNGGHADPDVDADIRAMVPVFYDVERGKTKVWMILGWSSSTLEVSFATPPRVEVLTKTNVAVEVASTWRPLAAPVMVEAYVSRILDRDELRATCDRLRTVDAIVAALV